MMSVLSVVALLVAMLGPTALIGGGGGEGAQPPIQTHVSCSPFRETKWAMLRCYTAALRRLCLDITKLGGYCRTLLN
jgi:hypothetical protein